MTLAAVEPIPFKAPPHSLESEQAILGAALIAGAKVVEVAAVDEGLRPEAFYREKHAATWRAMLALVDGGHPVDTLTVSEQLASSGNLEGVGGRSWVEGLTAVPPAVSSARRYAEVVVRAWRFRVAQHALFNAQAAVDQRDEDALQTALSQVSTTAGRGALDHRPEAVAARFAAHLAETHLPPLPLPWPTLARRFRMRPGATTVLASWTSWGKSWVAVEIASHVGAHGTAVVWTNEMSEEELVARHVQRETSISSDDVLDAATSNVDPKLLAASVKALPFGVRECFGWPADEVARDIRHLKPTLAVVDHFHQIPGIGKPEHAEHAVQSLTNAARQSGTHLLLVAQLNTARDTQADRPDPTLRDLRSTGALQSLPNNVMFLRRKQEHDRDLEQTWLSDEGTLHVAKQRGGKAPLYQKVWLPPAKMTVRETFG